MNDSPNPYQPPESDLTQAPRPQNSDAPFYVVSHTKFLVLFFSTFSAYSLYWFYKHWTLYQARSREPLMPWARAAFSIFFVHRLFRNFSEGATKGTMEGPSLSGQATLYVVLSIVGNLISRIGDMVPDVPLIAVIGIALFLFTGVPLATAQTTANIAAGDPEGASNSEFTQTNRIVITVGLLFTAIVMLGIVGNILGHPV